MYYVVTRCSSSWDCDSSFLKTCFLKKEKRRRRKDHSIHLPAQSLQTTTPRLMDAQSGFGARQSAQLLFDSLNQIFSATSKLATVSAIACCNASIHSFFSLSDSAVKLKIFQVLEIPNIVGSEILYSIYLNHGRNPMCNTINEYTVCRTQ